jgi:hypothetical protein
MSDGAAITVPWNASWSGEDRYEVRPCRWVGGKPAIWSPHKPGVGRPVFAKPHMVRQRQSVARFLCTVCGEPTPADNRWWFGLGEFREGWFMTTEAPVHRACAELALTKCPHLRGRARDLAPFPSGWSVLSALVGGVAVEKDYGLRITPDRPVIGHLKFAWPAAHAADRTALAAGRAVVIPADGLGTGLAQLPQRAPRINAWLVEQIAALEREG